MHTQVDRHTTEGSIIMEGGLTTLTKSWNETTPFPFIARSNRSSLLFIGTWDWNFVVLKAAMKSFAGISPNPSESI